MTSQRPNKRWRIWKWIQMWVAVVTASPENLRLHARISLISILRASRCRYNTSQSGKSMIRLVWLQRGILSNSPGRTICRGTNTLLSRDSQLWLHYLTTIWRCIACFGVCQIVRNRSASSMAFIFLLTGKHSHLGVQHSYCKQYFWNVVYSQGMNSVSNVGRWITPLKQSIWYYFVEIAQTWEKGAWRGRRSRYRVLLHFSRKRNHVWLSKCNSQSGLEIFADIIRLISG